MFHYLLELALAAGMVIALLAYNRERKITRDLDQFAKNTPRYVKAVPVQSHPNCRCHQIAEHHSISAEESACTQDVILTGIGLPHVAKANGDILVNPLLLHRLDFEHGAVLRKYFELTGLDPETRLQTWRRK